MVKKEMVQTNVNEKQQNWLKEKAKWVRKTVLDMSVAAKSGHVTTAFSQCEMLVALYYGKILNVNPKTPKWPDRDRFILSKGQGGIGTYPILADLEFFDKQELINFTKAGSMLGVHSEWNTPGVELLTGSLGHGLPMATGMALEAKLKGKQHKIFCLLGDGELFEGSNWEALFFASHYELSNLICIVDRNKQSTLGFHDFDSEFARKQYHKDGPSLNPLDKKWEAFGFEVRTVENGHDFGQIFNAFADIRARKSVQPLVIISHTMKGRGSTVTENQRLWHYRVPAGDELVLMRKELEIGLEAFDEYKKTLSRGNNRAALNFNVGKEEVQSHGE